MERPLLAPVNKWAARRSRGVWHRTGGGREGRGRQSWNINALAMIRRYAPTGTSC